MSDATKAWRRLMRIAARQGSMFLTRQAEEVGVDRMRLSRMKHSGELERWARGLYALAGVPDSWERRAMAAILLGGPSAVIGGLAAAYLHGLLLSARTPPRITLVAVRGRVRRAKQLRPTTTKHLPPSHRTSVKGLAVTSVERTIVDLADTLTARELERVVAEAWRRGMTTPSRIATCLDELGGVDGAPVLRELLTRLPAEVERARSPVEVRGYLELRDAGVPLPLVNEPTDVDGERFELDLSYPDLMLAYEVDGRAFHTAPPDAARDRHKDTVLRRAGWTIRRVPASEILERPQAFVERVERDLRARGVDV